MIAPPKAKPAVNLTSDAVPASCATTITPSCLQALYGIPTTPATVSTNQLGVSGFIEQFANQADLKVGIDGHIIQTKSLIGIIADVPDELQTRYSIHDNV